MEKKRVLLCLCHMGGQEMKYIEEAFADNWVVPLGPNVNGFEADVSRFLASAPSADRLDSETYLPDDLPEKSVVALSAGTAAIHLGLIACGVAPGDEVMVQSFTFSASANPVRYLGATPVFVDSEPESWNMDPDLLDRAIADRIEKTGRRPKAIVPVYLYGMPARIDAILAVAEKWGIPVIEDAAEAFGSRFRGRCCGTFGRFGVLSFNGNKMITTSGGGALIAPSPEEGRRIMFLATQARENYPYYQHEEIGYNYRMSNICAGIGRGQMEILDSHIAHHRHVQDLYRDLLSGVKGVRLHDNPSSDFDSNFWLCALTLNTETNVRGEENAYATAPASGSAPDPSVEALRLILDADGIESRPLWKPMHLQPVFSRNPAYTNGTSESLFRRGLCLPAGPWVTDDDVRRIADIIADSVS